MSLRIALFCVLLPLVISWEQSFVDTEEAEQLRKSVVYLSSYNSDLSPSVCPPENKHSYHPTSCPYVNRRDAQIEIMQRDEVSDVMCLQVKKKTTTPFYLVNGQFIDRIKFFFLKNNIILQLKIQFYLSNNLILLL